MKTKTVTTGTIRDKIHKMKSAFLITIIALAAISCNTTNNGDENTETFRGDFVAVTSFITDANATQGSSFLQTADLDKPIDNNNAYEIALSSYAHVNGTEIITTENIAGDLATRYVRDSDGHLTRDRQLTLPPNSFGSNVVWARPDKAYLSLFNLGKIWIFNPQTMEQTGEIDLTELDITRNSANSEDRNPDPAVMAIREGKLYVGLHQITSNFLSENGVDIAVIDIETDQFERVISDDRSASPGRYGFNSNMFVDEEGDLYIYNTASFGFVPNQRAGFLRIPKDSDAFDPGYFLDTTEFEPDVPGNRIATLLGLTYAGNGIVYAMAEVPALQSSPPNYSSDRYAQPVRIDLYEGTLEVLPLPRGTGGSIGIVIWEGAVYFGINAATGSGIYRYDPATGEGLETPVTPVSGALWVFLPLRD